MAQVEAASCLSVVVRSGPVRTAVNGTFVARPVRMTPHTVAPLASPCPHGEACPGDQRSVARSLAGARGSQVRDLTHCCPGGLGGQAAGLPRRPLGPG
jgi:hypothetical protein